MLVPVRAPDLGQRLQVRVRPPVHLIERRRPCPRVLLLRLLLLRQRWQRLDRRLDLGDELRPPRRVARLRRERREPEDRDEAREPRPQLRRVGPDVAAERVALPEGVLHDLPRLALRLARGRGAVSQGGERGCLPTAKDEPALLDGLRLDAPRPLLGSALLLAPGDLGDERFAKLGELVKRLCAGDTRRSLRLAPSIPSARG